jgi:hypothetical protein
VKGKMLAIWGPDSTIFFGNCTGRISIEFLLLSGLKSRRYRLWWCGRWAVEWETFVVT